MNHKVIAVVTLFALLQLIQAVHGYQTGCSVKFNSDRLRCYFDWRDTTECVGAREYFFKQLSCGTQGKITHDCSLQVSGCTGSAATFGRRCADINGKLFDKKIPPSVGKCNYDTLSRVTFQ